MQHGPRDPAAISMNPFGEGYYRTIIDTDQLSCGELMVPAHAQAGHDAGHQDADEVFYIVKGTATVEYPTKNIREVVGPGCYLLIPRNLPHVVSNHTDGELLLIFSCVKSKT